MQKRVLMMFVLAALCLPLGAKSRTERVILSKYDVDSASDTFCVLAETGVVGPGKIETTGASATVTAVTGYSDPFTNVAVGDEITATSSALSASVTFTVVAKASATSITADRAVNLDVTDGTPFSYKTLSCGTAATNGWFKLGPGTHQVMVHYVQGDLASGLDVTIGVRYRGTYGGPLTDWVTFNLASAGDYEIMSLEESAFDWRVGLARNGADASDTGTDLEQVNIVVWTETD